MKKHILIWLTACSAIAASAMPLFVSAQTQALQNPLAAGGISDIPSFISAFLKAVVEISLPILTLFIVYSGFMFIAARGNESKLNTAKQNFLYVILGAILILGAWVLATLIGATVTQVIGS